MLQRTLKRWASGMRMDVRSWTVATAGTGQRSGRVMSGDQNRPRSPRSSRFGSLSCCQITPSGAGSASLSIPAAARIPASRGGRWARPRYEKPRSFVSSRSRDRV